MQGHDELAQQMERYFRAFPDLHFTTEQVIWQENNAAVHWIARGTHRGTLMNIPPTGRRVEVRGITLLTINAGKIKQAVHVWDIAGLLRELGLLPDLNPEG